MNHKQGDTFDYLINIPSTFANGHFVGWDVTAQLRSASMSGKLIAQFDVAWVDAVTTRTLRISKMVTSDWPIGNAEFDVQFKRVSDGYVLSTASMELEILKDITKP